MKSSQQTMERPLSAHGTSTPANGNLPAKKTRRRCYVLTIIIISVLTVVALILGLSLYYTLGKPSEQKQTTEAVATTTTTTTTPVPVMTCIACDSATDGTCGTDTAPSTTTPCPGDVCYLQKDQTTGAVTRGCIVISTTVNSKMKAPVTGTAQTYCSSYPPGQAGAPVVCLCRGGNCNDASNSYTVMGGTEVEDMGTAIYYRIYTCRYPTCAQLCFMDNTKTVRGCDAVCNCV